MKEIIHIRKTAETGEYMTSADIRKAGYSFDAKGGATIVIRQVKDMIATGIAICCDEDNYQKSDGVWIASMRALSGLVNGQVIDSETCDIIMLSLNKDLIAVISDTALEYFSNMIEELDNIMQDEMFEPHDEKEWATEQKPNIYGFKLPVFEFAPC